MQNIFNEETWDYSAKMSGDLGKNILTVGFASYFFKDLPLPIRITIGIVRIGLMAISVLMIATKKGGK